MNAAELFALHPMGAVVQFSDGTPQPPARFSKKLDTWKNSNGFGVYVGRTIFEDDFESITIRIADTDIFVINRVFTASSLHLDFTVKTLPLVGSILAFDEFSARLDSRGGPEAKKVWANEYTAREWATRNRYNLASCGFVYKTVAADGVLKEWTP